MMYYIINGTFIFNYIKKFVVKYEIWIDIR